MKVKSESEVSQLCPTLHNPMDCSLPGYSVHGISQARVLEWGAIAFSGVISRVFKIIGIQSEKILPEGSLPVMLHMLQEGSQALDS